MWPRGVQTAMQIADQGKIEKWPNDKLWTEKLIVALGHLVHKKEYCVCGKECKHYGHGEWLYDLVWLQNSNGFVVDAPLILESRWLIGYKNISEDFEKLLLGRARHRVMVFQQKEAEGIFNRLLEEVRNFALTQDGDR